MAIDVSLLGWALLALAVADSLWITFKMGTDEWASEHLATVGILLLFASIIILMVGPHLTGQN